MMLIGVLKDEHELVKTGMIFEKKCEIEQGAVNCCCGGLDCKYFRHCRPHGLCQDYSTLLLQHESGYRQ